MDVLSWPVLYIAVIEVNVSLAVTMQIKLEPNDEVNSDQDQEEAMQTYDGTTEEEEAVEKDIKDADEGGDDQEQKPGLIRHVVQRTPSTTGEDFIYLCIFVEFIYFTLFGERN